MGDGQPTTSHSTMQHLLALPGSFSYRRALAEGWRLTLRYYWLILGAAITNVGLYLFIRLIAQVFRFTMKSGAGLEEGPERALVKLGAGLVLLAFAFLSVCVVGPLFGGMYAFVLRLKRGESPPFSQVFEGFGLPFFHLALASIVFVAFGVLLMIAAGIPIVVGFALTSGGAAPGMSNVAILLFVFGALLGFLPMLYLMVAYNFMFVLIIDKRLNFWHGMEVSRRVISRNWFKFFAAFMLTALIGTGGVWACCIGLFFSFPYSIAVFTCIYSQVFGDSEGPGMGHLYE